MRKVIMILGTVLIAAVLLISGSAVATWIYATSVYSDADCENSENALDEPDGEWATVGTNNPDPTAGDLILDFGFVGIPDSTNVVVYGQDGAGIEEFYDVRFLKDDLTVDPRGWLGNSSDWTNNTFTTGIAGSGRFWEFIEIKGLTGSTGPSDLIYGPEIDAVGYDS